MKIKSFLGGFDKNFSYLIWCDKTKIAAIIIGIITINDLILLAIFLDEAWVKDFNAQIKKIASIANIKNLI